MQFSLCKLCVLCASVVENSWETFTTEAQRTQRSHRGFDSPNYSSHCRRAIRAVNPPPRRSLSQLGDRQRVKVAAGEPTRPQVPVAAIEILQRDGELETLHQRKRPVSTFLPLDNGNRIDGLLNKANVQVGCLPIIRGRRSCWRSDRLRRFDHDLVAFTVKGQPWLHDDLPGVYCHSQAGNYPEAVQGSIVPFEFVANVLLFLVEVIGCQETAVKEIRSFEQD